MGIRPSVRSGTVGAASVVAAAVVVRFGLPACAGSAHKRAASTAAMKAMGERMTSASAKRPGLSIPSFAELCNRADPAVLGLAQQAAQTEEVVDPADDGD